MYQTSTWYTLNLHNLISELYLKAGIKQMAEQIVEIEDRQWKDNIHIFKSLRREKYMESNYV